MKLWIERLASLKLTVVLLLVVGVVLAIGTIFESLRGAEAARAVYYAPWFFALQGLFGLNLLAALITRWPRNRFRIGFALTHASMLLILAGALMTALYKVEGRLPIWEGESSDVVFQGEKEGDLPPLTLPFKVRLDSFEIDTYPGTQRPAMFRSRVVVEPGSGPEQPGVIQMNQPLSYGGYNFFQSSYQIQGGREMTILSVSKDPGQNVVFAGYVLLVAGMIVVFFTRLAQQRMNDALMAAAAAQTAAKAAPGKGGNGATGRGTALALLLLTLGAAGFAAEPARAALVPEPAQFEALAAMPVQFDGRTMPFDTQARNAVWTVTKKRAWPEVEPVAMVAGWVIGRFHLERWVEPFVFETKLRGKVIDPSMGLSWDDRLAMGREEVVTILRKIWPYLLVGIGVGAIIHGWVPEQWFADHAVGPLGVPIAVGVGVPLYSNAAGVMPLVQALHDKGMPMGTVLAFMMSVVALSLPEMILLRRVLQPKLIATFVAVVATGIIATGYLFNAVI